jgi:hypothetical protein
MSATVRITGPGVLQLGGQEQALDKSPAGRKWRWSPTMAARSQGACYLRGWGERRLRLSPTVAVSALIPRPGQMNRTACALAHLRLRG